MAARLSPLYPILDAGSLPASPSLRRACVAQVAQTLAEAGVTLLQYRNKLDPDHAVLDDARWLRAQAPPSLRILLNDRAHLVIPAGCDGVHVGQDDITPQAARSLLGPDRLIGLSTHDPAQLLAGDLTTADYLAIGPIYATRSKLYADPVVGLAGLERARSLTHKPLVAIGGITLERAPHVRAAGADSLAVISALFPGPAPGAAPTQAGDGFCSEAAVARLQKLAEDFLGVFR